MQRTKRILAATATAIALTLVSAPAAAETLTVAWDMSPEQGVVGYIVHIGSEPGSYTQRVDVGNTTTYVLTTASAGQQYCFAVSAYFAGPIEGARSQEVCTSANLAPTLTDPGYQIDALGAQTSLTLAATDPEGAMLTFSAIGLPPGLTIGAATGTIAGAPTQTGTFAVRASVSDGASSASASFSWLITSSVPSAPTLRSPAGPIATTTPVFEWDHVATATRYRLWVDDNSSTNPRVQVDLTPSQAGCAISGSICRHNPGVALAAGPASWSVRASNAVGDGPWSGARDFSVADGRSPVVTIVTPTTATTHSTGATSLPIGGTATDDVGVVQVTWSNDRGGAGSATGTATWSVAAIPLSQGTNVITVTARDAENNTSVDRLTVTRTDGQQPTVEITLPTTASSHRTTETTVAIGGTAADGFGVREVRWSSSRGASGIANGTSSWGVPAVPLQGGSNIITVTARDDAGNSATDTIVIDVADGAAPSITIVGPTSAATHTTTSATIALSGTASDAFGVTQVTWANSGGGSGVASGTTGWSVPSIALQAGDNVITVTARDAAGMTATDTLTVTRSDGGTPVVTITTPTSGATHSTSQATVALSGSASDDLGVTAVSWASDRGGSGAATGTTAWSVAAVPLQGGANTITVTARDASGRTGTDVLVVTLTDGDRPTVTISAPTAADTHSSATAAFEMSGTATDSFGIAQVTWTSSRGGGGTATGTTAWSATGIRLQPGANVLTVTARDTSGNTATDTLTVTLTDNTAPTVAITSPTDGPTHSTLNPTVPLGGTASDLFGVTEVRWSSDRGVSGVASGTTAWTVASVALSPGANVITVTARDAAGQSSSDTITVTRTDGDMPTVAITTPTSNPTHAVTSRTIALGGTARDNFGITQVNWASDRGGSGVAAGTSTWSVPSVTLQPGANVITITARDASGNAGRAALTVTLSDGAAPEVRFVTPTAAASFAATSPTLTVGGSASDEFSVSRVVWTNDRGGSGVATGTTSWSATVALRPGVNLITVTATDGAGNSGSARLSVTATDSTRPTVAIATPQPKNRYLTASSTVSSGGTAADDFGLASISWTNDRGGSGSASGTTAWSIASVALQPGTNVITITATDQAGNSGTDVLRVISDSRRPTVTISQPVSSASYATNTSTLSLGGAATDDQGVTQVSWSSSRGRSGAATGTTSWTVPGVTLDAGINVLTVTARDEAGNTASATLTVVFDGRAPGITIESPTTSSSTAVNVGTISLRGSSNDDVGVTQVTWTNDRGGSGAAIGATSWAIASVALQPGANLLTVTARDAAGNTSTDTLSVHFDTRSPVVAIVAPTGAAAFHTTSAALALAGSATDDGAIAEVRWANSRGGSGVATGTSRWTVERAALQVGTNEITITARDVAGNSASARLVVTATDRQAPAIRIMNPSLADAYATSARLINLDGTASDDFGVTQIAWASDRGASGVARGTDRWLVAGVALQPGVNVIAVTAVDSAGNSSSDVLRITLDGQLPLLTITSPASSPYSSPTSAVVLSGTASDDNGITQVMWATDRGASGAALGTTTWSTPSIRLEPGTTVVAITARDGSGNSATVAMTVEHRDTSAPTVSITAPTMSRTFTTSATTVNLAGTASDALGVTQVSWATDKGGAGIAFGTSAWSAAAVPLAVGVNLITVTARDAAGLMGTAVLAVTRTDTSRLREPSGSTTTTPTTTDPKPASTSTSALSSEPQPLYPTPLSLDLQSPTTLRSSTRQTGTQTPSPETARGRQAPEETAGSEHGETPPQAPAVLISAPTDKDVLVTSDASLTLAGIARDAVAVTWSTSQGASGTATGRDRWSVPNFAVPLGTTVVSVTARNAVGDLAADTLTIRRRPANAIQLDITSPTADSAWSSSSSTVALRGSASDNVVRVTWEAEWGGSGTATGTRSWTISTIGLQVGVNRVTVTAQDAQGRIERRVLSVTYRPQVVSR